MAKKYSTNHNDVTGHSLSSPIAEQPIPENIASISAFRAKVAETMLRAEVARELEEATSSDLNSIVSEDSLFGPIDEKPEAHHKLWDAAQLDKWGCQSIRWLVEDLIPSSSIVFIAGPPKDYKSFLSLYICLLMSQPKSGEKFLDRFACKSAKILYQSIEDSAGRIKERIHEIIETHKMSFPDSGHLQFLIRKPLQLINKDHMVELKQLIKAGRFDVVVFDTLSRSMVGLDDNSAKDIGEITSVLENIRDETGVTIICIDHTRKPQGLNRGRNSQAPNPFNLRGSIAKYAMAEAIICLTRKDLPGRLHVAAENKDTDKHLEFFIDVSSQDSPEPKFKYGDSIELQRSDIGTEAKMNQFKILTAIGADWINRRDIETKLGMKKSTVQDHLEALFKAGKIIREKRGQMAYYKRDQDDNTCDPEGES